MVTLVISLILVLGAATTNSSQPSTASQPVVQQGSDVGG
jgi:hypothetical protein